MLTETEQVQVAAAVASINEIARNDRFLIQSAARAELLAWTRSLETLLAPTTPVGRRSLVSLASGYGTPSRVRPENHS